MDERQLLRKYVQDAWPEAFEELVGRHLAMVYATTSRVVSDRHLAEDVSQSAFLILAQKAKTMKSNTVLGGCGHPVGAANRRTCAFRRRARRSGFR